MSVYAPARASASNSFFSSLFQYVPDDGFFLLCGDFNCVEDSVRDVRGPGRGRPTSNARELVRILTLYNLRDGWLGSNGTTYTSTWSRGSSSSRLDRVYVPSCLATHIKTYTELSFSIAAGYISDHCPVSIVFDVCSFLRPRGDTWRLDVSLLRDGLALSSLRRSIGVSLTVVPLFYTR